MPEINPAHVQSFAVPDHFAEWLKSHHDSATELWLHMHKKHTGIPSVTWEQAVLEALCWGWIDGIRKSWDDVSFMQRFTPRKPKSMWSQRNREHVERLIAEGRMQPSGLAHVTAAQADGRWANAYAPASQMQLPDDFLAAVRQDPVAQAHLDGLTKAQRYTIAHHLTTAKRPETRQRRFEQRLDQLKNQQPIR